ncbi:MAG: hypothetical protein ACI4TI_01515 [Christensenellales bacterium]
MRKFRIKNLTLDEEKVLSFEPKSVFIPNFIANESFNIVVKVGDHVKKWQTILQESGQKIASPISGIVKSIKLGAELGDELVYYTEIENDFKNLCEKTVVEKVDSKQNLIELCKNFGLVGKHGFVSKIIESFDDTMIVDAFDETFVFNNFLMLKNEAKVLVETIKKLAKICDTKKVKIFVNKKNLGLAKSLFSHEIDAKNLPKIVIKTKQCKKGLNLVDLVNINHAFAGEKQTQICVSVVGGALKKNCVLKTSVGTKICDIIEFLGGTKQNFSEIEDFKYMSLVAFNDEMQLKQKIKQAKTEEDKQKLINLLNEKKQQATENVFSRLEEFHQKFLDCLSACLLNGKNKKNSTKNFDLPLSFEIFGLHLLSFREFG